MSEKKATVTSSSYAYKNLLIFILAIQGVISTAWIIFERYTIYQELDTDQNLVSLVTALGGLLVILLAWVLLLGILKGMKEAHLEALSQLDRTQKKLSQQHTVSHLLGNHIASAINVPDLGSSIKAFHEKAGDILGLTAASTWTYQEQTLVCQDYYDTVAKKHLLSEPLGVADFPNLLQDLRKVSALRSGDVAKDEDLRELGDDHLLKQNAQSLLILPLVVRGQRFGICAFGWKQKKRTWLEEEIQTARSLADAMALLVYQAKQSETDSQIQETLLTLQSLTKGHEELAVFRLLCKNKVARDAFSEEQVLQLLDFTRVAFHNDAAQNWFPEVTLGTVWRQMLPETDKQRFARRIIENRYKAFTDTVAFNLPQGQMKTMRRSVVPILDGEEVLGFWYLLADLTAMQLQLDYLATLLDTQGHLLLVAGEENNLVYANAAAAKYLQVADGEGFRRLLEEKLEPEGRMALQRARQAALENQLVQHIPALVFHAEPQATDILDVHVFPITDGEGNPAVLMELEVVTSYVTARQEAEREAVFQKSMAENGLGTYFIADAEGIVRYQGEGIRKLFGYSPEERIGRHVFDFMDTEQIKVVEKSFAELAEGKRQVAAHLVSYLDARGNWQPCEWGMSRFESPEMQGVLVRVANVAHWYQTLEQEAQSKAADHYALLDQMPRGYIMADAGHKILWINPVAASLLETAQVALQGKPLPELVSPEERGAFYGNLTFLEANTHVQLPLTLQLLKADSETVKLACHVSCLVADGKHTGYLMEIGQQPQKSQDVQEILFRARFYHALVTTTQHLLLFLDENLRIKYCNKAVTTSLGFTPSGLLSGYMEQEEFRHFEEQAHDIAADPEKEASGTLVLAAQKGADPVSVAYRLSNAARHTTFKGLLLEGTVLPIQEEEVEKVQEPPVYADQPALPSLPFSPAQSLQSIGLLHQLWRKTSEIQGDLLSFSELSLCFNDLKDLLEQYEGLATAADVAARQEEIALVKKEMQFEEQLVWVPRRISALKEAVARLLELVKSYTWPAEGEETLADFEWMYPVQVLPGVSQLNYPAGYLLTVVRLLAYALETAGGKVVQVDGAGKQTVWVQGTMPEGKDLQLEASFFEAFGGRLQVEKSEPDHWTITANLPAPV